MRHRWPWYRPPMPTYLLVEIADDGTASVTPLTDPVQVTVPPVDVPLATLFPPAAPPEPVTPPA